MKSRDVYGSNVTLCNQAEESINDKIENFVQDHFDSLKAKIFTQISKYEKYNVEHSGLFSKHGKAGLERAGLLKEELKNCEDIGSLAKVIDEMDGGNYRQHSLRTYVAKAFFDTFKPTGVSSEFSDDYDKDVGIKLMPLERAIPMSVKKTDIGVKDFFSFVIDKIKECFPGNKYSCN